MAIPPSTVRCSLIGHLPQGEIFNTSFWLGSTVISDGGVANTLADNIANAFEGLASNPFTGLLATGAGYDEVRVYSYPSGGPSALTIGSAPISGEQGAITSSLLPLQSCIVATLRTGFAGRRNRGRMYFPFITGGLVAHQTTVAHTAQLASALSTFFGLVNALPDSGSVSVVSQVGVGAMKPVTSVEFDTKLDIQRRHANRQAEVGTSTAPVTL